MFAIKHRFYCAFVPLVGIGMIGDFSKSEPSQASQNALKNLINCGQAAEAVSRDPEFTTGPEMTGKAFFEMIKRCNGLCADQSASRGKKADQ